LFDFKSKPKLKKTSFELITNFWKTTTVKHFDFASTDQLSKSFIRSKKYTS